MHHKKPAVVFAIGIAMLAGALMAANDEPDRATYYAGREFRVSVEALDPSAASPIIARGSPLHSLYMSDQCHPDGHAFVIVMDAVEGGRSGPLWRGVQVEFNPGYPCRQFHSEDEIAAAVKTGEIALNPTGYVYRCRVTGPGK